MLLNGGVTTYVSGVSLWPVGGLIFGGELLFLKKSIVIIITMAAIKIITPHTPRDLTSRLGLPCATGAEDGLAEGSKVGRGVNLVSVTTSGVGFVVGLTVGLIVGAEVVAMHEQVVSFWQFGFRQNPW